ncbi:MAG: diacylglycerol kinase family protein [Candidatus Kerfeldbacteria bacterium]|nr:diacylglycerol kinase family protein [Candidatus Kerfeldbacteria bacterium]
MWISIRTLRKSFLYAWKGFMYTFRNEQNFRLQNLMGVLVILAMVFFRVTPAEAVALIFMIVAVLVLEILNTIVERFIDILKPRLHDEVAIIKDMMAAAVFLAACGSIVVGFIIFTPYVIALL